MAIEVTLDRGKSETQEAIAQFAARRGYQLTHPWYLDGLRIEDVGRKGENLKPRPAPGDGFWRRIATLLSSPAPGPRVDIELKRRKGRTIVSMSLGDHHDSVHLGYTLRSYLADERSFICECPPLCPACTSVVRNPVANYCGQCGGALVARPTFAPASSAASPAMREAESHSPSPVDLRVAYCDERDSTLECAPLRKSAPTAAAAGAAASSVVPSPPEETPATRSEPGKDVKAEAEAETEAGPDAGVGGAVGSPVEDDSGGTWNQERPPAARERRSSGSARRLLAED